MEKICENCNYYEDSTCTKGEMPMFKLPYSCACGGYEESPEEDNNEIMLEELEEKVRTQLKDSQDRLERAKKYRERTGEEPDTFKLGRTWGYIKAYSVVFGMINEIRKEFMVS